MSGPAWDAGWRRWRREVSRRRLIGMAWTVLTGGFAVGGWFVGHRYWHEPTLGVCVGLFAVFLVWGVTDKDTRGEIAVAGGSFALGVPAIYVLVLLTSFRCWLSASSRSVSTGSSSLRCSARRWEPG
jgi:hypothetical protein